MKCQRVRRLLLLHVGGDLPPRTAERVQVHLDGCEACHAELRGLEGARQSLFVLKGAGGAAPDLWPGVRMRIAGRPPRALRRFAGLMAAGVIFMVAGLSWLLLPSGGPPPVSRIAPVAVRPEPAVDAEFLLAEVGLPANEASFGAFPSVIAPDLERRRWDDF